MHFCKMFQNKIVCQLYIREFSSKDLYTEIKLGQKTVSIDIGLKHRKDRVLVFGRSVRVKFKL